MDLWRGRRLRRVGDFAFVFFGESDRERTPPAITHPEFFYGFVGLGLAWQSAFLCIASDPPRYRLLMLPAVVEKFSFAIAAAVLYFNGRLAATMLGFGSLDALLGVLFLIAYWKTAGSSIAGNRRARVDGRRRSKRVSAAGLLQRPRTSKLLFVANHSFAILRPVDGQLPSRSRLSALRSFVALECRFSATEPVSGRPPRRHLRVGDEVAGGPVTGFGLVDHRFGF